VSRSSRAPGTPGPFGTRANGRLPSEAEVVLKGGQLGRLLEPLITRQIRRMGRRSLAAFKYLVDHGEPPRVPHAKLAPAPITC
jgi:hypothetical protein